MFNAACSTAATQSVEALNWLLDHAVIDEEPLGLDELDEQLYIFFSDDDPDVDEDQSDRAAWSARIEVVENLVIAVWGVSVWVWILEPGAVAGASEVVERNVEWWRSHSLEEQTAALRSALVAN